MLILNYDYLSNLLQRRAAAAFASRARARRARRARRKVAAGAADVVVVARAERHRRLAAYWRAAAARLVQSGSRSHRQEATAPRRRSPKLPSLLRLPSSAERYGRTGSTTIRMNHRGTTHEFSHSQLSTTSTLTVLPMHAIVLRLKRLRLQRRLSAFTPPWRASSG